MSLSLLVQLSPLITLFGFMIRDQLYLRLFIMVEPMIILLFFLIVDRSEPGEAAAAIALLVVNIIMVLVIWHERTHFALTADQRTLMDYLRDLSPGEFRRLLKITDWLTIDYETELTTRDQPVGALFFVLEGAVKVQRENNIIEVNKNSFIGELGIVLNQPASATTKAMPGAKIVRWQIDEFNLFMDKHPNIKIIFDRFINQDLARKLRQDATEQSLKN